MAVIQEVHQSHRPVCHACFFQALALGGQGLFEIRQYGFGLGLPVKHLCQRGQHFAGFLEGLVAFLVHADHIGGGNPFKLAGGGRHF